VTWRGLPVTLDDGYWVLSLSQHSEHYRRMSAPVTHNADTRENVSRTKSISHEKSDKAHQMSRSKYTPYRRRRHHHHQQHQGKRQETGRWLARHVISRLRRLGAAKILGRGAIVTGKCTQLKPGFHYPSWRPELTARVDGWPVSITRQHGWCWRARGFH